MCQEAVHRCQQHIICPVGRIGSFGVHRNEICGSAKAAPIVETKEALIVWRQRSRSRPPDGPHQFNRRLASAAIKVDRDKTRQKLTDDLINAYAIKILAILQD